MTGDFILFFALVGVAGVFGLIYWVVFCHRSASLFKSVTKTVSVLLLALAALVVAAPWALVCALMFCALGDYLLSLDRERSFLAGVGAFAMGHIFYIAAFLGHPFSDAAMVLQGGRLAAVGVLLLLAAGMAFVLFRTAGALRFAVLGYVPVIVLMGVSALTLPFSGLLGMAILGALSFVFSDFVLALELFVLSENNRLRRVTPFLVWGSYWGAQCLMVVGVALFA
nr:lysoplasmalogenase [Amylibacter sp.]